MKLTDIMFNLEYIAANCGAEIQNAGDVFYTEEVVATSDGKFGLSKTPVPIISGGQSYVWYRAAENGGADMEKVLNGEETLEAGKHYCVMYKYTDDAAKQIKINAQFIPSTLHAVLTVALYLGDACDVSAATKAGEVEIDIPRFQLNGAMDITMSATGAAQTPLEGNALAFGCAGCEGDGIYATITKVLFNTNWYDDCTQIILENASRSLAAGEEAHEQYVAYACYKEGAPKQITSGIDWTMDADGTGLSVDGMGMVTGTAAAGTAVVHAVVTAKPELKADGVIIVA